jgi:putative transcription antitermination factor YqgF
VIILTLDIGKKRTGAAFADTKNGTVVAKNTIHHATDDELLDAVAAYARELHADALAIGLPLLPDGSEGDQAKHTRSIAEALERKTGLCPLFIDERYTSASDPLCQDRDAMAACAIADIVLIQRKKSS